MNNLNLNDLYLIYKVFNEQLKKLKKRYKESKTYIMQNYYSRNINLYKDLIKKVNKIIKKLEKKNEREKKK